MNGIVQTSYRGPDRLCQSDIHDTYTISDFPPHRIPFPPSPAPPSDPYRRLREAVGLHRSGHTSHAIAMFINGPRWPTDTIHSPSA